MSSRVVYPPGPLPYRNVFVMIGTDLTPQRETILAALQSSLGYYGFNVIMAGGITGSQWEKLRHNMDQCEYGVAIFDRSAGERVDPDISLELGYMLGKGIDEACLILKEEKAPLPTALRDRLCGELDGGDTEGSVIERIREWMTELGVLPAEGEKLIVFVSHGGIDRCAMAKVILKRLLHTRKITGIRVESAGRYPPCLSQARGKGRQAIEAVCGEDLLASHKPQPLSDMLKEKAELILVMADSLRKDLPSSKTHNFKTFFGLAGDIDDPAGKSLAEFVRAATEIKEILETPENLQALTDYLAKDRPADATSPVEDATERRSLYEVIHILSTRLDEGDLRTLCFGLGVDYENLPGSGKANKTRELVAYLGRRGRIPELVAIVEQQRPDISLPGI